MRRIRRLDLAGKSVLITGGSRGLGLLLAEEFGRRGARVAICGRDAEAVERARRVLGARGIEVIGRACDLGDRDSAEAFVDEVARVHGRIDVIVNNAGIIQVAPLASMTVERIEEAMRSNFWSAVHVTFRALPYLRLQGEDARIVNIVSIGGRVAVPHLLSYDASKFAFMGFSEGLRAELGGSADRIPVTTVVPAPMRTGSFYNAEFGGRDSLEFSWFSVLSSLPLSSRSAERAARKIVAAARDGRPIVHIGLAGRLLALIQGVAPGLTVRLMTAAAALLPAAPGWSGETRKGRDVPSGLPGSLPMRLGDAAARRNNEPLPERSR